MTNTHTAPVSLITGAARRVGKAIAEHLHAQGQRVIIHCHHSQRDANALVQQLNTLRPNSAHVIVADLCDLDALQTLAEQSSSHWQRLDCLVNNASTFYPTAIGDSSEAQWDDLFGSNAKAPFFLAQACTPALQKSQGCIINIADIHAERPLKQHSIYCMAKAANVMLTKTLAKELAPDVRVNGISPGAIMWPEQNMDIQMQRNILNRIPLQRNGSANDIAQLVGQLQKSHYITGQIIAVDGGRSLHS